MNTPTLTHRPQKTDKKRQGTERQTQTRWQHVVRDKLKQQGHEKEDQQDEGEERL